MPVRVLDFRGPPERPSGPPSIQFNGYRVVAGDKAARGVALTTQPHLAPRLKEEYNYAYTPSLCVLWHVIGWTYIFTFRCSCLSINRPKIVVSKVAFDLTLCDLIFVAFLGRNFSQYFFYQNFFSPRKHNCCKSVMKLGVFLLLSQRIFTKPAFR